MIKKFELKTSIELPPEVSSAWEDAFLDDDYVEIPNFQLYRTEINGLRNYVKVYDDGNYTHAPGVTSILDKVAPSPPALMAWKVALGADAARISRAAMDYGTYFHALCQRLLLGEVINSDQNWLTADMKQFADKKNMDYELIRWYYDKEGRDVVKDILGFVKFIRDYKVKPIALEYPVFDPDGKYAGCIDIVAHVELPTMEKKTVIIDIKSGLSGFYESYEVQLKAYFDAWNKLFPSRPAEMTWNWGPKDHRLPLGKTVIPYRLQDQTNSASWYKWKLYLDLFYGDQANSSIKKRYSYKAADISLNTYPADLVIEVGPLDFVDKMRSKK